MTRVVLAVPHGESGKSLGETLQLCLPTQALVMTECDLGSLHSPACKVYFDSVSVLWVKIVREHHRFYSPVPAWVKEELRPGDLGIARHLHMMRN